MRRPTFHALLLVLVTGSLLGCSAFNGRPRPYALCGVGSPARHNIEPMVGTRAEWESGAALELTYRPWFRVEDPSTRGFPREVGRVFFEAQIPLDGVGNGR